MHDSLIDSFPDEAVEASLGARFETVARANRDRLAVQGARHQWTYAELGERANAIAAAILERVPVASGPTRVLLLLDHDAPIVAAMLAVVKAGHVVVIGDPRDPPARMRSVVDDAAPALVVTSEEYLEQATEISGDAERVLNVDHLRSAAAGVLCEVPATAPALILYTSGTTGRPKGVIRNHRMALHSAQNTIRLFGVTNADRLTHLARLSVGQGQTPVWAAMCSGASLHMFDLKGEGVDRLADWLDDRRITVYHSSITVLRALSRTIAADRRFESVRVVRVGSEPVVAADQRLHAAHFPPASPLVNMFSLTEASAVSMQVVDATLAARGGRMPIGTPVPGISLAVVVEDGREAAPGEEGEMVVSGRYLSSGYWRDEALTRQRFSWHSDGSCTFRTGDRARRGADGELEFAGRADLRVKVRGYRVELEEVQACLASHPAVHQAVAVVERDEAGLSRLVAYFTTSGDEPTARDLRRFMLDRLPDQMAPTSYVRVPAMPLTASGKIDRAALGSVGRSRAQTQVVPSRTPVEACILEIWQAVLGTASIGVEDDFFVIGGDSLRAAQVLARLRAALDADVHFREFLRNSTVADLAALVEQKPRAADEDRRAREAIEPRDRAVPAPLSFPQQQLWLLDRLTPGVVAYNNSRAVRLTGPLDVDSLRTALDAVVARHSSLRTTFEASADGPVQLVAADGRPTLAIADLSALPPDRRDEALTRELAGEAERPFDLRRDVLLRARLVRFADNDHALVVVTHHIATDAWSSEILFRDLATFYAAAVAGRPAELAPLPIDYADFAVWQRKRTTEAVIADDLAYWLSRLSDAPPSIALPFDRQPAPGERPRAGRIRATWPATLLRRLEGLARDEGGTLFMVVMAAFSVLLSRYTGQHDLVLGSPMSGRRRAETESLVGFFANTGVFRISTAGDPTFRALIARVRDIALEAYDHQALPFERLIEALRPDRRHGRAPFIDVVAGVRSEAASELMLPGLVAAPIDIDDRDAKFALAVTWVRGTDGIDAEWTYDATRIDGATVARMVDHLGRLVAGLADRPDEPIGRVDLLSVEEHRRARVDWNLRASASVSDERLEVRFARQVARAPGAVAVQAGEMTVTYRDLDARATSLAAELGRAGVPKGTPVGILSDRSVAFVVGMLAALKHGSAYVPLDPADPPSRVAWMTETAGLGGVIVDGVVDCTRAATTPEALPPDVAYVMFTSGSTGQPKAVSIPHAGVTRLVVNPDYVTIGPDDALGHVAPTTFDGATFEIWGALLNGARLVIVPRLTVLDAPAFGAELVRRSVATLFLPSALFNHLGHTAPETFRGVRQLIVGGDVMDPVAAARVLAVNVDLRLVNAYGPTEATTFSTSHEVRRVPLDGSSIPIGRPISSTEVLILDPELRIVPVGVTGEICIGGPGLATGYVGAPERTTAQFISHPFVSGARLYRTGDLGAWDTDGVIRFLGRRDDQVKVRGHRIEPAEVEAAVLAAPGVRQTVVLAHGDPVDRSLVAYVVPVHRGAVSADAVRGFVAARVPEYMVPASVVFIDALPLKANGKVDRLALPPPVPLTTARAWEPPREGLEMRVAAAWRDVLRVDRVGRNDHFFELGGHSLTVVQLLARLEAQLSATVPARWIFEAPVLAAFAARLDRREWPTTEMSAPEGLSRRAAKYATRAPAAPVQACAWARRGRPGDSGYMVMRVFDVDGDVDRSALSETLTELVHRHEALRTRVCSDGDAVVQEILEPYVVTVEEHDLRDHPDALAEADRRLVAEARTPFTFAAPPWVRSSVVRLPGQRSRVTMGLPHVVYDGWSLDILYREIEVIYDARRRGVELRLDPPPFQFADFTCADAATGETRDVAEIQFWRGALSGLGDVRLPLKRAAIGRRLLRHATRLRSLPGVKRSASTGIIARAGARARSAMTRRDDGAPVVYGRLPVAIDPSAILTLRAVAAEAGTTLFTALLTAGLAVLAHLTSSEDVAVATFTSNRDRPEFERIVGNLGNLIIIRSRLSTAETFASSLRRVSRDVVAAREHSHVWYETMSDALTRPGDIPIEYRVPVAFQLLQGLRRAPRFGPATVTAERTFGVQRSQRIAITLHEQAGMVSGSCGFDPRLFDTDRCENLVRAFVAAVHRAARYPNRSLGDLVAGA